jgi:hypothetical protein
MYTYEAMLDELRKIAKDAEHVWLDRDQLRRVADTMRERLHVNDFGVRKSDAPGLEPGQLLQYFLIAGSHNFLFWELDTNSEIVPWHSNINGDHRFGAATAYACHYRAVTRDRRFLDADYLASMTLQDMADHYRDEVTGEVTIKLLPQRLAKFNEIGNVLKTKYDGSFLTLFERAEGYMFRPDGQGIAQRLVEDFPFSYGDWPFCKLIMVTMGNLYAIRDTVVPAGSPYRPLIELRDPETITVGADYYRPFYFYRVGILKVSDLLQQLLAERRLIPRDSQLEREFRAWTILAAQELADELGVIAHDTARESWGMGFMRCRPCYIGVPEEEVPCPYRDFCYSYQEKPSMMQALWPLVLTTNY